MSVATTDPYSHQFQPRLTGKVLLVEDDVHVLAMYELRLQRDGYTTARAGDGLQALQIARRFRPDVIVLDWWLPGLNGTEICAKVREWSTAPIIMLTNDQDKWQSALAAGADEYVIKAGCNPFELSARVQAMLRRVMLDRFDGVTEDGTGWVFCGPLTLNMVRRSAQLYGLGVILTSRELELLALLVRNPNRTFTRDELIARCWNEDFDGFDRSVDSALSKLRGKLDAFGQRIESVRNVGYRFRGLDRDP